MRRFWTLVSGIFISFASVLSGLTPSQAGASECFTVTDGVVSDGASCTGAISIPDGVTSIENNAFSDASGLTAITLPEGLTSIGDAAFLRTSGLTSITIPASVTSIASWAFYRSGLSNVRFLGNAPTVGTNTFADMGNAAKAYVRPSATGFGDDGDWWNGLTVAYLYTVTFNSKGGSTVSSGTFFAGGSIAAPSAPTRSGFTFTGWSATDGGAEVSFPYTPRVARNITLYANWTSNSKAVAVVKPTVTGTARVGQTLTALKGTWTGTPTPTFTYQWYSCSSAVTSPTKVVPSACRTISGADDRTFALVAAQRGKWVTVLVSGTSAGTTRTSWLAASTGKVG